MADQCFDQATAAQVGASLAAMGSITAAYAGSHNFEIGPADTRPLIALENILSIISVGAMLMGMAMERLLAYLESFGGTLSAAEVASMLRISPETLDSLTQRQHLVAFRYDGETLYPALQFHDGAPIPHLAEILDLIPCRDPVAMLRFLVSYDPGLGATRAEALVSGHRLDLVRSRARQVNVQIAR